MKNDHDEERGFRQIGDLMGHCENSLHVRVLTPTPLPMSSETTGPPSRDSEEQSLIGTQLGETGADEKLNALRMYVAENPLTPLAVNSQLRRGLKPRGMSWNELSAALPVNKLIHLLKRLRALTLMRKEDLADMEITIEVYSEKLSRYPADIVIWVLEQWPERSKWFPAWKELQDEIEFWAVERDKILLEMRKGADL